MSLMAVLLTLPQAQGMSATNVGFDAPNSTPSTAPRWADKFEGTAPDFSTWRFDTARNKASWYNNEQQHFAARTENTRVEDGHLLLEARREALSAARLRKCGGEAYRFAKLIGTRQSVYSSYETRQAPADGAGLSRRRGSIVRQWLIT